jgi:hypothetical protein
MDPCDEAYYTKVGPLFKTLILSDAVEADPPDKFEGAIYLII